jgi:hypothetical protein
MQPNKQRRDEPKIGDRQSLKRAPGIKQDALAPASGQIGFSNSAKLDQDTPNDKPPAGGGRRVHDTGDAARSMAGLCFPAQTGSQLKMSAERSSL